MKYLVIPLAIVGVVVALLVAPEIQQRLDDHNRYAAAADALSLERQETALRDYQQQTAATATSRALSSNIFWLAAGVLAVIAVGFIATQAQRRAEPLVRFHGQLVPRRLVEDGRLISILAERLMMDGQAQIAAAQRPNVPANYAPHLIQKTTDLALPDLDTPAAAIDVIMPRADWLQWLDQQPHILLGGKTKAGKTTLATGILAERLRNREQVFIIDPHSGGWLGLPTAGSAANDGELKRALGAVLGEYLARMQARDEFKRTSGAELPHDHWPRLTVLIDECNSIADEYKAAWSTIVKQLASGSRKCGISLLCLGQSALVEDIGISSAMRSNFARLALDEPTVQAMIDSERDKDRKAALRSALVGMEWPAAAQIGAQTWLLDRRGMEHVSTPAGARAQVWAGWDFDAGKRAAPGTVQIPEPLNSQGSASDTPGTEIGAVQITPEIVQIVRRMRTENRAKKEIIYLIWGAKSGGSQRFKDASAAYDQIVAGETEARAA